MAESPNGRTASGSETPDLDAWLATRRECPHCGIRTPDGTADLTSWYGFHASVCATLAVDRTAPTAIYNVKTCVECRLLVSAALYNEHQGICREGIPGVTMRSLAEQADLVAKTSFQIYGTRWKRDIRPRGQLCQVRQFCRCKSGVSTCCSSSRICARYGN
jgi:hypothetical protein